MDDVVSFVHLSDTHIGPTREYGRHGVRSYPCAAAAIEVVNGLPVRPDFVIHTGDVVTEPNEDAYALAAELFARLQVPVYFVVGNHDTAVSIRKHLKMGPKTDLSSEELSYAFEVNGHRFVVLDARAPDELDPHGLLSDAQLAVVRDEVARGDSSLTFFMHFPILPMNSPWMDNDMLVLNGAKLHEILRPARERIRGVFHGHIHQSLQVVKDGIGYTAVASTFSQFSAWATDVDIGFDPDFLPSFNFVQYLPTRQTIVHQHTFCLESPTHLDQSA